MPLYPPPLFYPTESSCPRFGPPPPQPPLPFSSASGGTALPSQASHMTNTKAYGWAVAVIHHVVVLGVGGRREERERTVDGDDGRGMGRSSGVGGVGNYREGTTEVFL